MQVANIMEEQNRLNEAYGYIQIACQTYSEVYGDSCDNTIIAQWLKLQIAYTQSNGKNSASFPPALSNPVIDSADNLFKSLKQREDDFIEKYYKQLSENYDLDSDTKTKMFYSGFENVDELKEEMDKIKIMCIATHIMEMTRMLPDEDKLILERFCDKIMLSKYQQDQEGNQGLLKTLLEYKNKHIDLLSVKKVSNLVFKEDGETWFKT